MPVQITGPWSNLKFKPELGGLIDLLSKGRLEDEKANLKAKEDDLKAKAEAKLRKALKLEAVNPEPVNPEVENQTAILIQLETVAAVEQAAAFADIDGVDGIFFGPADIGADMGILGKPMDPEIWKLIRPAARKLMERGMPVGTLVSDASFAAELLNDGFSFVACGSDTGLLAKGADNLLASVRGKLI